MIRFLTCCANGKPEEVRNYSAISDLPQKFEDRLPLFPINSCSCVVKAYRLMNLLDSVFVFYRLQNMRKCLKGATMLVHSNT